MLRCSRAPPGLPEHSHLRELLETWSPVPGSEPWEQKGGSHVTLFSIPTESYWAANEPKTQQKSHKKGLGQAGIADRISTHVWLRHNLPRDTLKAEI